VRLAWPQYDPEGKVEVCANCGRHKGLNATANCANFKNGHEVNSELLAAEQDVHRFPFDECEVAATRPQQRGVQLLLLECRR